MRGAVSVVCASALLLTGLWLLRRLVFEAEVISGRSVPIGGFVTAVGGIWLYADFVHLLWRPVRGPER